MKTLSLKKNAFKTREDRGILSLGALSRDATRKEAYKECVKERVFFLVLMSLCVFRVFFYIRKVVKKVEKRVYKTNGIFWSSGKSSSEYRVSSNSPKRSSTGIASWSSLSPLKFGSILFKKDK